MPRPALALYRHLPIAHKHRCLLLDVSQSPRHEVEAALPRIESGFTGMIATATQLSTWPVIQECWIPKVVWLSPTTGGTLDSTVVNAQALGASGVMVEVILGDSSSVLSLSRLDAIISQSRAAKLTIIARIGFAATVPLKSMAIMQAYALRLGADLKLDYVLSTIPLSNADLATAQQIADGGSLLLRSTLLATPEIRRTLTCGADGIVVALSELMTEASPGQTAYRLGEAVFGPGSYQPG